MTTTGHESSAGPADPTAHENWGAAASRTVTWNDPLVTAAAAAELSGLEFLTAILVGELPPPPIGTLFNMRPVSCSDGEVVFTADPDASMYNPIGVVHGGLVCTLLDSVLGCAVHSTLPRGAGYTSIELKVSYLRAVTGDSGPLTATGRVTKRGRRVCFTDGEVVDGAGRTVATASSSLLIIPLG